jgi:hypothetical protein
MSSCDDDLTTICGGYHAVVVPDIGPAMAVRFNTIPEMVEYLAANRCAFSQLFCFGPEGRYPTFRSGDIQTPIGVFSLVPPKILEDAIDDTGTIGQLPPG